MSKRYYIGIYKGDPYLVPCEFRKSFDKWVKNGENDPDDVNGWLEPEYAKKIEGSLTFEKPLIYT